MEDGQEILQLIDRILSGEKCAFAELYDRTIQEIYRTVHFLLDEKVDVDDVVQETYIQIYRNLEKYDRKRAFKPWITGIAIKQIHTYRRKKWMTFRIMKKAEQFEEYIVWDTASGIIDKLSHEKLAALVNDLPFKLKQAVILHYFNELTQEETAAILNIPLGTVKSRIHAALKRLRKKGNDGNLFFKEAREIQ